MLLVQAGKAPATVFYARVKSEECESAWRICMDKLPMLMLLWNTAALRLIGDNQLVLAVEQQVHCSGECASWNLYTLQVHQVAKFAQNWSNWA
jgi:hypothetical protein